MNTEEGPLRKRRRLEAGDDAMEGDVSVTNMDNDAVNKPNDTKFILISRPNLNTSRTHDRSVYPAPTLPNTTSMSPSYNHELPMAGSRVSNTAQFNKAIIADAKVPETGSQSTKPQETSQNFDYLFHNNPLRLRKLFDELSYKNTALEKIIHETERANLTLSGRQEALVDALNEQRALRKDAQDKAELMELKLKYFSQTALK
ncbi:hypothetical protein CALCODRAFT_506420 [Calocera cornea HHB12733]|uniref:Uncharacterized protein n=1 Tax=Calocera cornea HHB12733 TaxID=1353952 RepID=A0A165J0N8_9BASI|nr:hypothetical protein CALCODRAFT_506420 [Calocera cornea HHB12733]